MLDRWGTDGRTAKNVEGAGAVGYARQTPMLAGRVKAHGPYGWLGESKDLPARLVGGFGLHRWDKDDTSEPEKTARASYIAAFVRDELVPPPRPERPLTDEEQKGKAIFTSEKAACSTCHTLDTDYTNRSLASFGDAPPPAGFHVEKGAAYKTPSLLFVGGSPPYFHDGRYGSLEQLVDENADRMGKTNHLSPEEKKALVAFLRTL
jgi:cytochrome c peroxidase